MILLLTERLEFALHPIQTIYAILKLVSQSSEEASHMLILELVERTHNPIRLFARFHVIDNTVQPQSTARPREVLRSWC